MIIWQSRAEGKFVSLQYYSFTQRLINAIMSYVSYLGKTFWPVDLAVFYPYQHSFELWQVLGAASVLLAISVAVVYLAKRAPFLVVGWFWYLGALFPVSGILQAGDQAMADRYSYFPSVGIGIMIAWGFVSLLPKENLRKMILFPAAGIVLTILSILTWQQCGYWKNSATLFNHALQATKNNYIAHFSLGHVLEKQGKVEEAITRYLEAIKIKSDYAPAHHNLAHASELQGKVEEAIAHYREAIKIDPFYVKSYSNLGVILADQGKNEEAIALYREAINIDPADDGIHYNLANSLEAQGRVEEAIAHYREALRVNPDNSRAHINLGATLGIQLRNNEALYHFREALRIDPVNPGIHYNLGVALANTGRLKEAIEHLRRAVYLKSDYQEARRMLKLVLELEARQKH